MNRYTEYLAYLQREGLYERDLSFAEWLGWSN